MEIVPVLGIVLIVLALLGFLGVIPHLRRASWVLLGVAAAMILLSFL